MNIDCITKMERISINWSIQFISTVSFVPELFCLNIIKISIYLYFDLNNFRNYYLVIYLFI